MPTKLSSLDAFDVKILEALGKLGPRNMSKIAKALSTHVENVRSRIKHMSSLFYLRMSASVYHTNLGLKKAVVFAQATPGKEDLLFDCLKLNSFYVYLTRCYGMFEGCLAIYTIPEEHCAELNKFIRHVEKLGVAKEIQVFWSTCFHTINRTSQWFDFRSEKWAFQWDEWIKEIAKKPTELPYTLVEPKSWPMKADEIDLLIIPELEADATESFTEIAKKLKTTPQNVRYHYENHIIKRRLIERFQIFIFPFDRTVSSMFWFTFEFLNTQNLAKFALSLLDKPFVYVLGKILKRDMLVAQIYLPWSEFRLFVESLSKLCRNGLLESYNYVIQDLRKGKWSRKTIPFEDSKDGKWIYNHNKHIKDLKKLVKQQIS